MESEQINHQTNHSNISLDCLICLDLLCEPVTTQCGHTFCKFCLVSYLDTNMKCPICRNAIIITNRNSLSKNVLLSELAKSKNPKLYEERKNTHSIHLNESTTDSLMCVFVYLKDFYLIPGQSIELSTSDTTQFDSIYFAYYNQQPIVVSSSDSPCLSSMCNVIQYRKDENHIIILLSSIRRFEVKEIKINDEITFCSGSIVNDKLVIDKDYNNTEVSDGEQLSEREIALRQSEIEKIIKKEIYEKSTFIINKLNQLISASLGSIARKINTKLNPLLLNIEKAKQVAESDNDNHFIEHYQALAYMIIGSIKLTNNDKISAFNSLNLFRKIDNLYNIFNEYDKDNLFSNQSFGLELFEFEAIQTKEKLDSSSKLCIGMTLVIIFLLVVLRSGLITIN